MMGIDLKRIGRNELVQRLGDLEREKDTLWAQLEETKRLLAVSQEQASNARAQLAAAQEQLMESQKEESARREELAAAGRDLDNERQQAESLRRQLTDAQNELTDARDRLSETGVELEICRAELKAEKERADKLNAELKAASDKLGDRTIAIANAGSLADAAAQINGLFAAAQNTADQYLMNISLRKAEQERVCAQIEADARAKAEDMLRQAAERCEEMEKQMLRHCEELKYIAEEDNRRKWNGLSEQLQMISREIQNSVNVPGQE